MTFMEIKLKTLQVIIKMLESKKIYLRLMEEKDVPYKVNWVNNSEFRYTLNFDYPLSEISTKKWLHKVSENPTRRDFIVCDKLTHEPIGFAGLTNIDYRNSKAESYMGIGDLSYQGKGLGREVRIVLLEYAFKELNLNKVYSHVWEENKLMLELNKKVGFQIDGLLREDILSHGERRNRYVMSILKEEYLSGTNANPTI